MPFITKDPVVDPFISNDPEVTPEELQTTEAVKARLEAQKSRLDPVAYVRGGVQGISDFSEQVQGSAKELGARVAGTAPKTLGEATSLGLSALQGPGNLAANIAGRAIGEDLPKAAFEAGLRGASDLGQLGKDVAQSQVLDPYRVVRQAVQDEGFLPATKKLLANAPQLLGPGLDKTAALLQVFPTQAAEIIRQAHQRAAQQAQNREALQKGDRSQLGEVATALASQFTEDPVLAEEIGKAVSPPKDLAQTIDLASNLADPSVLESRLVKLGTRVGSLVAPTLTKQMSTPILEMGGKAAKVAAAEDAKGRLAKMVESNKQAWEEAAQRSDVSAPPLQTPPRQLFAPSEVELAKTLFSERAAKAGQKNAGLVQKGVGAVGQAAEKGGKAVESVAGQIDQIAEKYEGPLSLASTVAGASGGTMGALAGSQLPGAVRKVAKWSQNASRAGTALRTIAGTDWGSSIPVWRQIAKDPDAPKWLVRGVTANVVGKLKSGEVLEKGLRAGADLGKGILEGAATDAVLTGMDTSKSGEEIGGEAGTGGLFGALGTLPALKSMSNERKALAFSYDSMRKASESIAAGANPLVIAATPDATMHSSVILEGMFRGMLPGRKDLKVDLMDGAQFAKASSDPGAAAYFDESTGRIAVNLESIDADGRQLHEVGHALMSSVAGSNPAIVQHFQQLLGADGLARARQDYQQALGRTVPQDDAFIVGELFSEALANGLRGANLNEALPTVLGRTQTQSFFRDADVRKALKDPNTLELVRQQFQSAAEFRPAVDMEKEPGVKLRPAQAGNHPALPTETRSDGTQGNDFVDVTNGQARETPVPVVRARVRSRRREVLGLFPDVPPSGNVNPQASNVGVRQGPSGMTEKTGTRLGEQFYATARSFGDGTKNMLRRVEQAIANNETLAGWYQQIGEGDGWSASVRESLGAMEAQYKDFMPFAFKVDKQGNLLVQNYSLSALERKAAGWAGRRGPLSLEMWNGDVGTFRQDVQTYLKNHAEGRPGSDGLGENKRNLINVFLVGGNRTFEALNPLRVQAQGRDRQGIVRSYRADRLQTVEPSAVTGFEKPDYSKQVRNLSPQITDDLRARKDAFEKDQQELNSFTSGSVGQVFDRSFHLTKLVRRLLDGMDSRTYDRMAVNAQERGDQAAVQRYQARKQTLSSAMSYTWGTLADLTASLPEYSAKDFSTGGIDDPFRVLKKYFPGGQKRPIGDVLKELAAVVESSRQHEPGKFPTQSSGVRDVANIAEVVRDFADVDQTAIDELFTKTWGRTEAEQNAAEAKLMGQLTNPEFNDVTKQGSATIIQPIPTDPDVRNSPEIDPNLDAVSPDVRDRAVNINDKKSDFTGMILRGEKTIETRDTPRSLRPFIGKRVGLVSTGKKGSAQLVGSAVVGEPKFYRTEAEFRADFDQHRVEPGSEYDIGPNGKWGYPLSEVRSLDTQPAPPGGRVARILPEGTRLSPEVVKLNKKTALQINSYNHAQQLFDRGYTLYGANNDGFDDSPNLIRTSDEIDNYDPENMVAMVPKGGDPVRNSPQVSSEQLEMDFDKAVDQLGTEEALSLEKPSPAPRAPRQPKDAPTTFSITASRIKRLLKRGPVNPIGMSAATPQDRHAVAALFRNPAFEAMRWVFLKEGKVVAVANTTVRRPEMVYIMTKNIDEQQMAKLAAESGADSVFWTHNHPSGNSRPSDPDINATRRFWGPTLQSSPLSKLNFLGHIVTNHTDHHLIDVEGRISLINVGGFHDPMLKKPVWDAIVDSPPALARAGAALANGDNPARLILFLDPRMNVKAVGEISPNLDSLKFAQEVRKYAKATGATSAVAYGHLGSDAPMMKQLVQDGILVDAHIIGSGGVRTALMAPPPALLPSPPVASAEDQIVRNVGEKLRFSPRIEQSVDALDKLGDKTLSQVNAKTLKYPKNPAYPKSIALPARWGLVNEKIVGMPKTSKEVSDIVVRQVDRLERVIQDMPDFAKESARFYLDMGLSSLDLASSALPGSKGLEQHKMADLMLRFLALGSPRTGVAANATKSSYSVSAAASDFTPGLKIGFGAQQRGAREAMASWKKDQPFDLNMPGIDNKVRNFYLNGLSEIIDLASADGDTASYEHLMNNVAGSLGLLKPGEILSKNDYTEVKRLLDGMATVDMWDMAAKGFAWPGYLIDSAKRNDPEQPWQWSQDKFAQDTTMGDSRWPQILKELSKSEKQKINGPEGLRYQQARALRIEGNKDWSEKTWQARLDSGTPFGPETPITVFTEGSEAGLSPGGAGPQYDAQQSIDGLVSDEINSRGLAPLFGKEKLFARNAQEILWALERLDNPVKANNELVLFGQTFKAVKEALQALQLGEKMSPKNRGNAVLDAMDRAYESMASQDIPIEVVSAGSTPEAARIQNKIAELKNAGVTDADRVVTESVAAGMMSFFNETAEKHGVNVILDNVRTGLGGYSEKGSANKAPNMVLRLRGNVPEVRRVLEILSRSMDQDGGNIFRRPTIRELNDPKTKLNNVLTLDTQGLTPDQQWAFFSDLNKLKDAAGNSFLTGFTQTGEGMAIGDQFYTGDMVAAIDANKLKIAQVMRQHGVGGLRRERLIVDTFFRGTPAEKSYGKGGFVKDLTQQIQNQIESAAPAERRFPMAGDATTRIQRLTKEAVYARFDGKSKATRYFVDLASQVDVAILRDEITEEVGDAMKADINRIAKRKIAQAAEKTAKAKAESAKVKEETAKAKISKEPLQ